MQKTTKVNALLFVAWETAWMIRDTARQGHERGVGTNDASRCCYSRIRRRRPWRRRISGASPPTTCSHHFKQAAVLGEQTSVKITMGEPTRRWYREKCQRRMCCVNLNCTCGAVAQRSCHSRVDEKLPRTKPRQTCLNKEAGQWEKSTSNEGSQRSLTSPSS